MDLVMGVCKLCNVGQLLGDCTAKHPKGLPSSGIKRVCQEMTDQLISQVMCVFRLIHARIFVGSLVENPRFLVL